MQHELVQMMTIDMGEGERSSGVSSSTCGYSRLLYLLNRNTSCAGAQAQGSVLFFKFNKGLLALTALGDNAFQGCLQGLYRMCQCKQTCPVCYFPILNLLDKHLNMAGDGG